MICKTQQNLIRKVMNLKNILKYESTIEKVPFCIMYMFSFVFTLWFCNVTFFMNLEFEKKIYYDYYYSKIMYKKREYKKYEN